MEEGEAMSLLLRGASVKVGCRSYVQGDLLVFPTCSAAPGRNNLWDSGLGRHARWPENSGILGTSLQRRVKEFSKWKGLFN